MKKVLFVLLIACFGIARQAQADTCSDLRTLSENSQIDIGSMVDPITRFDGISVSCGLKSVVFQKTLFIDSGKLREGWEQRKQSQWNQIYCQDPHWKQLILLGWSVSTRVIIQPENRLIVFNAVCPIVK